MLKSPYQLIINISGDILCRYENTLILFNIASTKFRIVDFVHSNYYCGISIVILHFSHFFIFINQDFSIWTYGPLYLIYLFSCVLIYVFFELKPKTTIFHFVVHMIPILVTGSFLRLLPETLEYALCSFFLNHSLNSGTKRCSGYILYSSFPHPGMVHFPMEPRMVVRNQGLCLSICPSFLFCFQKYIYSYLCISIFVHTLRVLCSELGRQPKYTY